MSEERERKEELEPERFVDQDFEGHAIEVDRAEESIEVGRADVGRASDEVEGDDFEAHQLTTERFEERVVDRHTDL